MAGGFSFCTDILKLIRLARSTAALQPDGSNVPNTRCASILKELCDMTDPTVSLRLDTLALTYARRIAKLTREKVRREGGWAAVHWHLFRCCCLHLCHRCPGLHTWPGVLLGNTPGQCTHAFQYAVFIAAAFSVL